MLAYQETAQCNAACCCLVAVFRTVALRIAKKKRKRWAEYGLKNIPRRKLGPWTILPVWGGRFGILRTDLNLFWYSVLVHAFNIWAFEQESLVQAFGVCAFGPFWRLGILVHSSVLLNG